jgi:hypothetical protein
MNPRPYLKGLLGSVKLATTTFLRMMIGIPG